MSFNLAIDQGNSSSKVYVFEGENIVDSFRFDTLSKTDLVPIYKKYDIHGAVISSVQNEDKELNDWLQNNSERYIELTNRTSTPMNIKYNNAHLLGHDRIAAAVGAMSRVPGENVLVIDAGTAITLDVVNSNGTFLGGNISPGLSIRFQALNNYTDKLPLVTAEGEVPIIGHDTITAIRSGVVLGLVSEIEGYITRIANELGELKVFITGGDCHFLASHIKNPLIVDENLLANGLNRILLYNNENI